MEAECADSNERAESPIEDAAASGASVIEALPVNMDGLLVSRYGEQISPMLNAEKHTESEGADAGAPLVREPAGRDHEQEWLRGLHRSVLAAFDEQLKRALIRGGVAPEVLPGPELTVSLADISIIDWIQAIQLFAKHAVITVIHDETQSRLWCSSGELVDAESGRLRGEAALYRIASLERGQVVTELREEPRPRRIRASTPGLLLEAARRKDESALLRGRLGNLGRFFQSAGFHGAAAARRQRPLDPGEATTLDLFPHPRRLVDALADSALGELETLAALDNLIRAGRLIEAPAAAIETPPPSVPAEDGAARFDSVAPIARSRPAERAVASSGRSWGSTAVVALSVAAAAWLGARSAAWSPGSPELGVERAPVAQRGAPSREPETYAVALRTTPASAELSIDGRAVGKGEWRGRFPRDGAVHELVAAAAGHVPLRVLFIDTPPPFDLHLDPLPGGGSSAGAGPVAALPSPASSASGADLASASASGSPASSDTAAGGIEAEAEPRGRSSRAKTLASLRAARRAAAAERAAAAQAAQAASAQAGTGQAASGQYGSGQAGSGQAGSGQSGASPDESASDDGDDGPRRVARSKRKPFVQLIDGEPERAAGLAP